MSSLFPGRATGGTRGVISAVKTGFLCYLSDSTGENEPECYDTHNTQSDDTAATPEDRIDIGHEE